MAKDFRQQYEEIFSKHIKRDGAREIFNYLKGTDFFTAPASVRRHSSYHGGLVEHHVKVYHRFCKLLEGEYGKEWLDKNHESVAIIALLHDVCKINCYKTEMRNTKVDGAWVQKPYFAYEDSLPYGHGEKSVYIISGYMKLTRDEAFAINWHMGGFDPRNSNGLSPCGAAFYQFPIAAIFHAADFLTTYLDEKIVE